MSDSSDDEELRRIREIAQRSRKAVGGGGVVSGSGNTGVRPPDSDDDSDGPTFTLETKSKTVRPPDSDSDSDVPPSSSKGKRPGMVLPPSDSDDDSDDSDAPKSKKKKGGIRPPSDDSDSDDDLLSRKKKKKIGAPPDDSDDSDDDILAAAKKKKAAAAGKGGKGGKADVYQMSKLLLELEDWEKKLRAKKEPFDSTKKFTTTMSKRAKYSKKWVKRFITLQDRTFGYGADENSPPKKTFDYTRCIRGAERGLEKLTLVVSGEMGAKRELIEVVLLAENRDEFETWYRRLTNPLVHYKMIDPIDFDIPIRHPKTNLTFISVPLDNLSTFMPLDRLCLHFFSEIVLKTKHTKHRRYVFIGDRMLYVCRSDANITRCIDMKHIHRIITSTAADTTNYMVGSMANVTVGGTKLSDVVGAPGGGGGGVPGGMPAHAGAESDNEDTKGSSSKSPKAKVEKKKEDASKKKDTTLDNPPQGKEKEVMHIGVQCTMPEFDLLFTVPQDTAEVFCEVLTVLHKYHSGQEKKLERKKVNSFELMHAQLSLDQNEFYKLTITLPMSKKYLARSLKELTKRKTGGRTIGREAPNGVPGTRRTDAPIGGGVGGVGSPQGPARTPLGLGDNDPAKVASPLGSAVTGAKASFRLGGEPGSRPAVRSSTGQIVIPAGRDKVERLLLYLGLGEYYAPLASKMVDWDVLSCMDASDLKLKGVEVTEHQMVIENALNDPAVMAALSQPPVDSPSTSASPLANSPAGARGGPTGLLGSFSGSEAPATVPALPPAAAAGSPGGAGKPLSSAARKVMLTDSDDDDDDL